MNQLSSTQRSLIASALVEGKSIRDTCQMTGAAKGTVLKLIADLGKVCEKCHDEHVRHLRSDRVQCEQIWSFVGAKMKNMQEDKAEALGDVWTWTAMDPDSKLIVSYLAGQRGPHCAKAFIEDVAWRFNRPIQITTFGHRAYVEAISGVLETVVDYAMLVELYGSDSFDRLCQTGDCIGTRTSVMQRNLDPHCIGTSFEHPNLTRRMGMRRLTRLTNGFSKKTEDYMAAIAIHFMHHNFCRVHKTLCVTPAMAAGIADHPWDIKELVGLLD